jgi:hypothetical protein
MVKIAGFRISPILGWLDFFWVGFFWSRRHRKLYFFPIPTVGVLIEFPMNIRLTATVRGVVDETRMFNTIQDARLYIKNKLGDDVTTDDYRITSRDGNTRIIVTGCDVQELRR